MTDEEVLNLFEDLDQQPVRGLEELSRDARFGFGFRCVRPDQRLKRADYRRLGNRWAVVIDDLVPARGPRCCDVTLSSLLGQATANVLNWDQGDPRLYRDVANAAYMGARVVIVRTDWSHSSRWREYLRLFERSGSQVGATAAYPRALPSVVAEALPDHGPEYGGGNHRPGLVLAR